MSKSNYETHAFWDIYWFESAEDLFQSAAILEEKVTAMWESMRNEDKDPAPDFYRGPYYMLVAYGFENLFKGAIVRKKSAEFKAQFNKQPEFPKELKSHDLVELAERANFKMQVSEEDLLHRLSRHSVWAGRYPIPTSYQQMPGSRKYSDGVEYSTSWYGGTDIQKIRTLISRVKGELNLGGI